MELTPSKKLPNFSQYLATELAEAKKRTRTAWKFGIAGLGFIGAAGAAFFSQRLGWPLWVALPTFMVSTSFILNQVDLWLKKPRSTDERYYLELDAIATKYALSMNRRRLHRELDYTAAQLLEASAYYWVRIVNHLNTPAWNSDATPAHLRAIRLQTMQAATEAMREQMALCARCLAMPGHNKGTDLREVLEDSLGIDVEKILDSLRASPIMKKGIQSEHLPEIFDSSRNLAEKLKRLSGEIDQMAIENMKTFQGDGSGAVASIDAVLRGLHEVRAAETELSDGESLRERL